MCPGTRRHPSPRPFYRHPVLLNARALEIIGKLDQPAPGHDDLKYDRPYILSLVTLNSHALQHASEELRSDKGYVMQLVAANGLAFEYINEDLKNDPDVVIAAVNQNAGALACVAHELRSDFEFMFCLVTMNRHALEFASEELKSDPELMALADPLGWLRNDENFVMRMVRTRGQALRTASWMLQCDPQIVLNAVRMDGLALEFAHKDLQKSRTIVKAAVESDGLALAFAAPSLQSCVDIVRFAVRQNWLALQYASGDALKSKEIFVAGVRQNHQALEFAAPEITANKDLMKYFVRKNGLNLKYASPFLRGDADLASIAVSMDKHAIHYVADELKQSQVFKKKIELLQPGVNKLDKSQEEQGRGRVSRFFQRMMRSSSTSSLGSEGGRGSRRVSTVSEHWNKMMIPQRSPFFSQDSLRSGSQALDRPERSSRMSFITSADDAAEEIKRKLSMRSLTMSQQPSMAAIEDSADPVASASPEHAVEQTSTQRPSSAPAGDYQGGTLLVTEDAIERVSSQRPSSATAVARQSRADARRSLEQEQPPFLRASTSVGAIADRSESDRTATEIVPRSGPPATDQTPKMTRKKTIADQIGEHARNEEQVLAQIKAAQAAAFDQSTTSSTPKRASHHAKARKGSLANRKATVMVPSTEVRQDLEYPLLGRSSAGDTLEQADASDRPTTAPSMATGNSDRLFSAASKHSPDRPASSSAMRSVTKDMSSGASGLPRPSSAGALVRNRINSPISGISAADSQTGHGLQARALLPAPKAFVARGNGMTNVRA